MCPEGAGPKRAPPPPDPAREAFPGPRGFTCTGIGPRAGIQGAASRHVFGCASAMRVLRRRRSIVALQQMLGHATLVMKRRYGTMVGERPAYSGPCCSGAPIARNLA